MYVKANALQCPVSHSHIAGRIMSATTWTQHGRSDCALCSLVTHASNVLPPSGTELCPTNYTHDADAVNQAGGLFADSHRPRTFFPSSLLSLCSAAPTPKPRLTMCNAMSNMCFLLSKRERERLTL